MANTLLERVRGFHLDSKETDYIMPAWMIVLPSIEVILSVMLFPLIITPIAIGILLIFLLMLLPVAIITLYVVYKWIDRMNKHFRRAKRFWSSVLDYLKHRGFDEEQLIKLGDIIDEIGQKERNPVLWILLDFVFGAIIPIPIVSFYINHFLNKEFHEHEKAEMRLYNELVKLIGEKALVDNIPTWRQTIPNRSTTIYIVLSFITALLFTIYWDWTLLNDPNKHFREQNEKEKTIIELLKTL